MAFTRRTVAGYGLSDEQLEKVMTLYATSLADYIPKSEVDERIKTAVSDALKNAPGPDIKGSEEYKALQGEFDDFRRKVDTSSELKQSGVKDKFIDAVYSMLDHEKPTAEQLPTIREQFEEYFTAPEPNQPPQSPQFGAQVVGQMPQGKSGESFVDLWGYGKKG